MLYSRHAPSCCTGSGLKQGCKDAVPRLGVGRPPAFKMSVGSMLSPSWLSSPHSISVVYGRRGLRPGHATVHGQGQGLLGEGGGPRGAAQPVGRRPRLRQQPAELPPRAGAPPLRRRPPHALLGSLSRSRARIDASGRLPRCGAVTQSYIKSCLKQNCWHCRRRSRRPAAWTSRRCGRRKTCTRRSRASQVQLRQGAVFAAGTLGGRVIAP